MTILEQTIKEIEQAVEDNPNQDHFEIHRIPLKYLLTSLRSYIKIEKTMRARFNREGR